MGKSSKKSATKVEAAVVPVPQSGKKGKRGAENVVEKALSAKKQKVERDATVIAKQKETKKQPKKAASSSSEEESDVSDSDAETKVVAKKAPAPAKNGSVVAKKAKEDTSSESDSDSSGSDSDEKPAAKKPAAAAKNGSVAVKKTPAAESSSSESDSDEDEKPAAAVKNGAAKVAKAASSDESDDDSDSSDEEEKAEKPKAVVKKPAESDSDDSSSDEEVVAKAAPAAAAKAKAESSDESDDDKSSDEEEKPKAIAPKAAAKGSESSEESSDEEESEDEDVQKTPKKKDTDVKMVDAEKSTFQKTPKTPATPEATGSKTLFIGNLSFSIEESDVREFFSNCGEVIDIRFAVDPDGRFKGFGHVEFATPEAAQKALELHEQDLVGRPCRLDLARERGAAPPHSNGSSFQRGGRSTGGGGSTAFVRGFDSSLGEDAVRAQLQELFEPCGAINRISIPPDHDTGAPKGMAYVEFADSSSLNAALEKNGENYLSVQEAKPRDGSAGGGRGGGGRSGGRDGGRGGRFSGGRGGRDGGRGGRFSGRGGRDGGRGGGRTPYRSSVPSGKKTTFGDD